MLDPNEVVKEFIPSLDDAPNDVDWVVLYHAGCTDGFASAFCFWQQAKDNIDYRPVSYAKEFPSDIEDGAWVWVVDFSYPVAQIPKNLGQVIILDHHKTAMEEDRYDTFRLVEGNRLLGVGENIKAYVDMSRSGTGIVWDYLNDSPLPPALACVQDRDLWEWKLQDSDAICLGLDALGYDFEKWDHHIGQAYGKLRDSGKMILDYREGLIKRALSCMTWKKFGPEEDIVPVVNTIQFPSEIGNSLCLQYPAAKYVVMWYERRDGRIQLSFRSVGDYDVGKLASTYGGGGHKNAAGAVATKEHIVEIMTEPAWWEVTEVQSSKLICN